jgi:hypothetical protein
MWPTQSTELTRARLIAWLSDSEAAALGAGALRRSGHGPSAVAEALHAVTEAPASTSSLALLVEDAKREAGLPAASAAVERWLLVHAAAAMLSSTHMPPLGDAVLDRTSADLALLLDDTWATAETLHATGIRFREVAKMATGRRFSAGLFHWDVGGVSRSWLLKVPLRDIPGLARALAKLRGLEPVMCPHLNPYRPPGHLAEPAISDALAAMAETLASRPDLHGFVAASWLRSPDVHRVSPHLAAVNAPIVAAGGFVTTVGAAPPECGVFERSRERARLYQEGRFTPTTGLVIWPRADMLGWWRGYKVARPDTGLEAGRCGTEPRRQTDEDATSRVR